MHITLSGRDDAAATTLVLSAGLGGLGSFWLPQLDALRARYRVVSYDQRGTGRSADSLPAGYSMQQMADELIAALDAQGIDKFVLVGHALGGLIGLQLALDHPQRLLGLVVVNGWLQLDAHTRRCFRVRQDLLLNSGVEAFVRAQPLFLYPADWLSRHQARIEAEDSLHIAHFQGTDNLLKRLQALMACDFSASAAQIALPVLLLCSRDDLLVPWTCSEQLQAALPDATLQLMDWGGHAMSVTDSPTFNRLLLNWLETTPFSTPHRHPTPVTG
ncbi:pyrimidine utilization protein D [Erwinia sp. Leaf53]|uniref:pyrimidine utilization protein D n=1 Tax=Erwinia sp. Leaf53 TaxID=1736225 RepID=UPI0006F2C79D|nr:pyrimidine utilization protein D [Erwinia sp. Leaf53]KQN56775.1 pyrimidine utilization protein D [Erwinia sp. Leaf53]